MKKSSKRAVSRMLAGVLLVSSSLTNLVAANEAVVNGTSLVSYADDATSDAALEAAAVTTTTWSFRNMSGDGITVNGGTGELDGLQIDATTGKFNTAGRTDWAQVNTGTIVKVPASEKANVSVVTYSAATSVTIGDKTVSSAADESGSNVASANATPVDGYISIVMNDNDYWGSITISDPVEESTTETTTETTTSGLPTVQVSEEKSFTFWFDDFATSTVSDEGAVSKTLEPGYYVGGGATIELLPGIGGEKYTTDGGGKAANLTFDDKTGVYGYKAGSRPKECNAYTKVPDAGSAIVVTPTEKGIVTVYGASQSFYRVNTFSDVNAAPDGYENSESGGSPNSPLQYSFQAEPGKTYVIASTGATNNCFFSGVEFVADEDIDINLSYEDADTEQDYSAVPVEITDTKLNKVVATITKADSKITLSKGHTYEVASTDSGVGVSVNGGTTFKADGSDVKLTFVSIPDVKLSGKFEFEGDAVDVQSITFTKMSNSAVSYTVTAEDGGIKDGTYTINIKPGEYNTSVVANGYTTYDRASVLADTDNVDDVYLESLAMPKYDLPTEVSRGTSNLTLNGITGNNSTSVKGAAGSSIVVPVSGKQIVTVAGWYSGTWDINGQNEVTATSDSNATNPVTNSYTTDGTETSVTINITGEKTTYLYWITVTDVDAATFKSEVSVPGDYATLTEANEAIKAMERPEGEEGRVTINLTDDLQEQVVIDAPYVTIKGNGHEINWYYGNTGSYYSIDSDGLYSETLFRDKYQLTEAASINKVFGTWGGVVIVRGEYFKAEDVTFKNTFNYEVTDKEIEDGATQNGALRTKSTDVAAYAYKERSSAFYIEADNIELKNCKILSSQDTLGRNGSTNNNYHIYFKNCVIGGNVDYICGEFTAVFDNCELQWKTYSDSATNNAKVGYITAAKTSPYIFRNCTVTTDTGATEGVLGCYGRTWGSGSQVYFVNTETNGLINTTAWGEMTSGDGASSKFFEYNNTSNGEAFEAVSSDAIPSAQVTDEATIEYLTTDALIAQYLANWTPTYYEEEEVETPTGLWGDADQSGTLTANDASAVLAYTLDPSIKELEQYNFSACDVDGNKGITASDAAYILQKVLDGDFKFPVEPEDDKNDDNNDNNDNNDTPENQDPVNVYVVGDSTGCDYINTDLNYYYKRVGFGTELSNYFNSNVTVNNYALSGRSSKSFTTETNYQKLLDSLSNGDYVLIAFGHNDEKVDDETRGTTPGGDKDTDGTFKNSLYKNYILPAQEKGATPILVTPIVRRTASGTWSDSQLHKANGGDYAQDIIDLGKELNLTVIDNTTATKDLYDTLTPSETLYLHAWTSSKDSSVDNTHLNRYGAKYVAYLMTEAIKASDLGLADYVKTNTAPTKADLEVNPSYVEPSTDDPTDLTSLLWTTTEPFYGSVFGDIGGAGKLQKTVTNDDGTTTTYADQLAIDSATGEPYYDISENADGTVHLRAGALKDDNVTAITSVGKVASGSDGLAMYYTPVDAGTNFEISGTITVNGANQYNQVAFGAIVSDMVRVDTYQAEKYTYVAASPIKLAADAANATYARIDGTLNYGPATLKFDDVVGSTVNVSIKKVGNQYTVTYGDTTQTYTVDMSGTVYAGFFVSRCADITVSNINFNNEVVE